MPMDFPDMVSLITHAKMLNFRLPNEGESETDYRRALADFVAPQDFVESEEIRNKHGWDKFTEEENWQMLRRRGFPI